MRVWCAICVMRKIAKDGRLNGIEGLKLGVTRVRGTTICAHHTAEALAAAGIEVPDQEPLDEEDGSESDAA